MKKFWINNFAIITASLLSFFSILLYFLLSWPLKRMWHGTQGDELFIAATFNRVIHGQYFSDFYTGWLPPFYPPLYFWFTGTIARFFASNGISAAKIGVMITFAIWFLGAFLWQKLGWKVVGKNEREVENTKIQTEASPFFWILFPVIFFLIIDYADIITKPYEAVTAFFCTLFLAIFQSYLQNELKDKSYKLKAVIFFGISGGLLFLTYYFWWFIIIPALFIIALTQKRDLALNSLFLVLSIGAIIAIIASPYLIPLLASYIKFGTENWQPLHFVYSDLNPYLPWLELSIPGLFYAIGLATMVIQWKNKFIRSNILTLALCYVYYLINVIIFLTGKTPWQTSKPFYFLGGAALLSSAAFGLSTIYHLLSIKKLIRAFVFSALAFLSLIPISKSLTTNYPLLTTNYLPSPAQQLAAEIKQAVPDAENRIWLSSGYPELNAYINLNYYVAHLAHFSHPASHFSQRIKQINELTKLTSPKEFTEALTKLDPPVTALLLYYNPPTTDYKLFFRVDDFGKGSKEIQFDLKPEILTNLRKMYDRNGWTIWLTK